MAIDIVRAELERLFELEELLTISESVLGFDPEAVGGTAAKGSYVRALTEHCVESDAVEALCEAMLASKSGLNPKIAQIRVNGIPFDDEFRSGEKIDDFTIVRKIGEGRLGISYLARRDKEDFRLKIVRREASRDRRGLHRFLTVNRLIASIDHPGLPADLSAGFIGDRPGLCHRYVEGQPLASRIGRTGPMHINEARPLLRALLEALAAIHQRRLSHGDLRLENVIVFRDSSGKQGVVLIDAGSDRLRARARVTSNGQNELFSTVGSPKTVAPEQIRGMTSDPRSDVYSFGAMLYEVLTGKPVFGDGTAITAAIGHLTEDPEPPSGKAPRGWVTKELDDWVLSTLEKDPEKRPKDAQALLEALELMGRAAVKKKQSTVSDQELQERVDALIASPDDSDAAVSLEAAVEEGADPAKVAEAFTVAAETLDAGDDKEKQEAKKSLLFRAARIFEHSAEDLEKSEKVYLQLTELDPNDDIAATALEDVRKQAGKYEELIEMLLVRGEQAQSSSERARAFAEIGRLYIHELEDPEQAVVAFTQAFCEDPEQNQYADELERRAEGVEAWTEVLTSCAEAGGSPELSAEAKTSLLVRMGRWYTDKVARPDLALPCYQTIIASDPANDAALEGMTQIYRKAQQWPELVMVLTRRADAAATPDRRRDLLAEAAEILDVQMGDAGRARDLYEQVLAEDPGHEATCDALSRIYERGENFPEYVKLLERRVAALRGEEQLRACCRLAEVHEDHLKNDAEAVRQYDAVLAKEPNYLDALRGLDRIYSKTGRYQDLIENLNHQVQLAATPRQKITLWERIAGIYDEEFLDHERAAASLETILEIDPAHQEAMNGLERHYRALDRFEDVASLCERQLKLATDKKEQLELSLTLGRVLLEQLGSPERATKAYEKALEIEPEHAGALEALARIRETAGDADAALSAIETLAQKATTPEAKAEQYVRAAKLLESRGDRHGAIDRFKRALDANPHDAGAAQALRAAYIAEGDVASAVQLLEREFDRTEGDRARAKLAGEMALLARTKLGDEKRAEEAAKRAVGLDPTNLLGSMVLGDIAFEKKNYHEAASHYGTAAGRAEALDKKDATRVLVQYVDALTQTGGTEQALAAMEMLLRIAPDDAEAIARVAQVTYEHGAPERAAELYKDYLERFGKQLTGKDQAAALHNFGDALRQIGKHDAALKMLKRAVELDPGNEQPLEALAKLHEAKEEWEKAIKVRTEHLDLVDEDRRAELLVQIGDIASQKLDDRTRATKSYVAALEEKPDDRKLLAKLMQLYSEEKDWGKLVDVVLRLADMVEEPAQRAKYLQTAAIVCARQMGDVPRALEFYDQVLELDPSMEKALNEAIELRSQSGDHKGVERLLQKRLERANQQKNRAEMLRTFDQLGELYEKHLGWTDRAIDAFEAAQTLEPEGRERAERLAELYASEPEKYLEKAVKSQHSLLRQNPYRAESYKLLRRLYTEVKDPDGAWSLCQALGVLKLAEPDEERFYKRMRSDTAAAAADSLRDEDWLKGLLHPDAEQLLTSVFALIEPAVIAARGQSFEQLGYDPRYAIDLARHPYPMSQTLYYAAGVLGMEAPSTFQNNNDPGGLSFLHAHRPSIVLGTAALGADVPTQAAAFIAGRHLAYYRPGLYVRQLSPSGTALKSWLFSAIKLIAPQFPVATELEGPVNEATAALEANLQGQSRDQLARIVSKLLQSGAALDLKRWVRGVDLTADRAGFLLCHDLETAVEILKASGDAASAVPSQERVKELVLYSVSPPYLGLRRRLRITVDS